MNQYPLQLNWVIRLESWFQNKSPPLKHKLQIYMLLLHLRYILQRPLQNYILNEKQTFRSTWSQLRLSLSYSLHFGRWTSTSSVMGFKNVCLSTRCCVDGAYLPACSKSLVYCKIFFAICFFCFFCLYLFIYFFVFCVF